MNTVDCFNGDADGICALLQMRLQHSCESTLISGVKRDIQLLQRVDAQVVDKVNVLDVSMDKNKPALQTLLDKGVSVFYCDHHHAGDIPEHDNLTALINTAPDVCTSLLINEQLKGAYREWAVVGAFGDNLNKSAQTLAKTTDLSETQVQQLQKLGIYINYNGYGAALEDLYFNPVELYQKLLPFSSPVLFLQQDEATFVTLEQGYHSDMENAYNVDPETINDNAVIYFLPNTKWARRVSGVFGNALANQYPQRAHAVLTLRDDGDYLVSVRAPLVNKNGAHEVCRQFVSGGGREAAAGINQLAKAELDRFTSVFDAQYRS